MESRRELIDRINHGVNLMIERTPGFTVSGSPALTVVKKRGTSADLAFLKLNLLAGQGVPMGDLMLGVCYPEQHAVALVKSSYRPLWISGRRPCLLVLDCYTNRVYRLLQTKYGRRAHSLAVTPYASLLLSSGRSSP